MSQRPPCLPPAQRAAFEAVSAAATGGRRIPGTMPKLIVQERTRACPCGEETDSLMIGW